jgi:hypothetical protein
VSSGDQTSVDEIFFRELSRLLEPVTSAATDASNGDEAALVELFSDMGAGKAALGDAYDPIKSDVTTIAGAYSTVETEVVQPLSNGQAPNLSKAEEIFEAFGDVFETLKGLDEIDLSGADVEFDAAGERIVDYLLITYLDDYHPQAHSMLVVLGVIQKDGPGAVGDIDLSAFGQVLQNPNQLIGDVFGWGLEEFSPYLIFYYVRELLWELGVPASLEAPSDLAQQQLQGTAGDEDLSMAEQQLRIRVLSVTEGSTATEMGVQLIPLPAENGDLPGLAVMPYGTVDGEVSHDISDQWTFNANMSAAAGWALNVRPADESGKPVPDLVSLEGNFSGEVHGEAELSFEGNPGEESGTTLIGNPGASRVAVRTVSVSASVDYTGEEVVFNVELPSTGTIGVHPSDFDGFLKKVMPGDGIFYDFDATLGWSSKSGVYFERGGTLEAAIPQNVNLGPLSMEEIYLAAGPSGGSGGGAAGSGSAGGSGASAGGASGGSAGDSAGGQGAGVEGDASVSASMQEGTIHIAGATSGSVTLGPVNATVKRIGVEADISFPEDADGNLGPADVQFAFKPPEGVGLSIDAGAVSGGGYLQFDHENERYAGVLQLKAGDLTINAVGLLTTELPGGRDGFSLLIMISGEFPPVQLGLGFTLNGVGGLAGVNRTMKAKPLGKAVREGSMDSILFPENPVANSQRIISDLRTIFPPRSQVHVFGPMARLGWGTPTLITADIGVVLEIPTWKIALLGRLSTLLPDEKAPLIELNLAVVGILEPQKKRVAIDATLYDSRVLAWSLSGDMALRSNWGENPRFALSVGGWNPRFEPPSDFPQLDRVKASLGPPGGNPMVELTGYFAVTSNTVQAGAGVHLLAEAGPAKVEGRLAFDALIRFNPFEFVVDILASISVQIKGKGLSIKLDGTLMGPGPFRVKGKIRIEILFIKITARVDVSIGSGGDKGELPTAKIMPELTEEFGKPGNWAAQRPESARSLVSVRDVETDEKTVLAHPMARVGVRQTVVPLDFEIEKFGNARPANYTKFTIESVTVGGSALDLGEATTEQFAPAQYTEMSDAEKIDSPAFEAQQAGRKMAHDGIYLGYDGAGAGEENVRTATLGYESSVIDKTKDNWATPLAQLGRFATEGLDPISTMDERVADSLSDVSAVANAEVRNVGVERFRLDDAARQRHYEQLSGVAAKVVAGNGDGATPETGTETSASSSGTSTAGADATGEGTTVVRRGGSTPDVGGLATNISTGGADYVIASKSTLRQVSIPTLDDQPVSKSAATRALSRYAEDEPRRARELQVVSASKARDSEAVAAGGVRQ